MGQHNSDSTLSIIYEQFDGGEPWSSTWHESHILYLHHLLHHLPDTGVIASEHEYLGSSLFSSYEEWWQSFGTDNFGDFIMDDIHFGPSFKDWAKQVFGDCHAAESAIENFSPQKFAEIHQVEKSSSIQAAHNLDGLVFWGTGGGVSMIPDIIQSAFTHCLPDHQPGLMEKCTYEQHNKLVCPFSSFSMLGDKIGKATC
jgi:hypothetical protein